MMERLGRAIEYSEVAVSMSRQKSREFVESVKSSVMNRRLREIGIAGTELRRWGHGLEQIKSVDLPEGMTSDKWQTLSFRGAENGFVFELSGISEEGIHSFSLVYHDLDGFSVAAAPHQTISEVSLMQKALQDPYTVMTLSRMPAPLTER